MSAHREGQVDPRVALDRALALEVAHAGGEQQHPAQRQLRRPARLVLLPLPALAASSMGTTNSAAHHGQPSTTPASFHL